MLRKLLTRPIWWWERKRTYPIRSRFHLLPPLGVVKGRARFVVLTTTSALHDAMWAAWSWYRYLQPHGFELQLAVDGEIPAGQEPAVQKLFPGISIYNVWSVLSKLCDEQPALGAFLRGHPVAKQVGLVLALSGQGPVVYCDHDVLAFNPPTELLTCIAKQAPCYFIDEGPGCHDPFLLERINTLGLDHIPRLNAGFIYVPEGALSIELAGQFLATWKPEPFCYFSPQTTMSVLMRSANAQALPEDRYVISTQRQFYSETDVNYRTIVARHFTGPVRHVMYRYGMPAILRQNRLALREKQSGAD
jgi:hypothetical protein